MQGSGLSCSLSIPVHFVNVVADATNRVSLHLFTKECPLLGCQVTDTCEPMIRFLLNNGADPNVQQDSAGQITCDSLLPIFR